MGSLIDREVTMSIVEEYKKEVMPVPTTTQEWKAISDLFQKRWNVPHAIGALDGKHIAIKKLHSSGSYYFNYKKFFSVVLMALVDADYKFIWVDMGGFGHMSDSQIFNGCELRKMIVVYQIGIPEADKLPHDDQKTHYFIQGDDIFAMR